MILSIVSYLDKPAMQEIRALQKIMTEATGSKACLSSWEPHVTVGNGISVSNTQLEKVEVELMELAKASKQFTLQMSGVGFSDSRIGGKDEETTPYVLWVNVITNKALLSLVASIKSRVTDRNSLWYQMPFPYTPHVTIAFKDLSKGGFEDGKNYLNNLDTNLTSTIDHIALVEKLEDTDSELNRFSLGV